MRYETVEWESRLCPVGEKCWCRMLFTVTGEEVMFEGAIDKELAEYIVCLHNNHLTPDGKVRCSLCRGTGKLQISSLDVDEYYKD